MNSSMSRLIRSPSIHKFVNSTCTKTLEKHVQEVWNIAWVEEGIELVGSAEWYGVAE